MEVITKSYHTGPGFQKFLLPNQKNRMSLYVDIQNYFIYICMKLLCWQKVGSEGGGKDGRKEGCSKINGCLLAPFRNALLSSLLYSFTHFTSPPSLSRPF